MWKRILKNKSLFISLLTFCFSLFCFITIGYAWISISKTASVDPFVGVMENQQLDYQFSQVIDGSLKPTDEIKTNSVIPGQINTFAMTITNAGTNEVNLKVMFTDIFSEIQIAQSTDFTKEYNNRYQKVQYAYSYSLRLLAYAPDKTTITNINDPSLVEVPTPDEVSSKGWEELQRDVTPVYFNKVNNDPTFTDVKDYLLCSQTLKPKLVNGDGTTNTQSTLVIYFTIKFNSTPVFDSLISADAPKDVSYDGEYYANQRFNISHITLQGLE